MKWYLVILLPQFDDKLAKSKFGSISINLNIVQNNMFIIKGVVCGTLKCENAAICEKVAKCENKSTLNVKIDAICEKITLNVKK